MQTKLGKTKKKDRKQQDEVAYSQPALRDVLDEERGSISRVYDFLNPFISSCFETVRAEEKHSKPPTHCVVNTTPLLTLLL